MPERSKPKPKSLEEHEPGATQQEVFQALKKVAAEKVVSKRKANQRSESPDPS